MRSVGRVDHTRLVGHDKESEFDPNLKGSY